MFFLKIKEERINLKLKEDLNVKACCQRGSLTMVTRGAYFTFKVFFIAVKMKKLLLLCGKFDYFEDTIMLGQNCDFGGINFEYT